MIDRRFVSPRKLFLLVWVSVISGSLLGSRRILYDRYGGEISLFLLGGVIWFLFAVLAFFIGTVIANKYVLTIEPIFRHQDVGDSYASSYPIVLITSLGIALLLLGWTLAAANQVGGIIEFIRLMQTDWQYTRRLWPNQKPFTGARLIYTGLIACTIYSSTLLGDLSMNGWKQKNIFRVFFLLATSIMPLFLIPLIVSQRVILAAGLFGGGIAFVISKRKGVNPLFIVSVPLIGFIIWTAQETIRTGQATPQGAIYHSLNILSFYFQASFTNITRGSVFITERGYGLLSFSFIFRYLFVNDLIQEIFLQDLGTQVGATIKAGPMNSLIMPYLDFGWFGLGLISIWGYFSQLAYDFSANSRYWTQVYGLLGATILVSWHQQFWSSPEFWFSLGLLYLFNKMPRLIHRLNIEGSNWERASYED